MPDPLTPPVQAVIAAFATTVGVDPRDARPLRLHDAATILLPHEHVVMRLADVSDENTGRARRAVTVTAWLAGQGFACIRPALTEPIIRAGRIATVWHEIPPHPAGTSPVVNTALGRLLRELHALPPPPFTLPTTDPLARLRAALRLDATRAGPVLDPDDVRFLRERVSELAGRYATMRFPLGVGLIHNDAHPGNLIPDPATRHGYVLADWEGASHGPRELDVVLVGAPGSRFGDPDEDRLAFTAGYGYDIAPWPEHAVLRDIRDLHSLAAYIRVAPDKPTALTQLRLRIRSIRAGDRTIRWGVA
jgi:hypothetical protein